MSDNAATAEEKVPIMLRADITRDEFKALRVLAAVEGKTVQALVGEALRDRIESST